MPYESIEELPENVKDNLPEHAQEIFMSAYNSAFEQYDKPGKSRGNASREETANKIAWSAVKEEYEKKDGKWQKK
jgi:cation transport regulator